MTSEKWPKWFVWTLAGIWGVRLWSMWVVPLMDTTEARYGEIARLMAVTGDWITPQHDYGVWYWGKPPLSTWLSALGIKMFGLSELAVRLPSWALAAGILWVTYRLGLEQLSQRARLWAIVILSSSVLFLVAGGAVMTDAALCLSVTLSMAAFWLAVETRSRGWGYAFFIGLAIGLLAKGPVALVLTGLPIGAWLFWNRSLRVAFRCLPWVSGTLVMLLVALPWYLVAEHKTPGFLEYFILGENIKRFLVPGWSGDLYGFAHNTPLGIIWVHLLGAAFPWSFVWIGLLIIRPRRSLRIMKDKEKTAWHRYLLAWALVPILFFSLSRNVIWTYCLFSLPPLALLLAAVLDDTGRLEEHSAVRRRFGRRQVWAAAMAPAALLLMLSVAQSVYPQLLKQSTKSMAGHYLGLSGQNDKPLAYVGKRLFSLEYYTQGRARHFKDESSAIGFAQTNRSDYILVNTDSRRSKDNKALLGPEFQSGPYVLMKINTNAAASTAGSGGSKDSGGTPHG